MAKELFENTKGVLFDLDGVVHVGEYAIPGAADVLQFLDSRNIPYRFVTNTTTTSPEKLRAKMTAMGLPIREGTILTTHEVAAGYLKAAGGPSCCLLVAGAARTAYAGLEVDETRPDFVVIGYIGERWNYGIINRVFNMVMEGTTMLALHKGRYWKTHDGLQVDIGAFVAGLEYATGKEAVVVGKPSPTFFAMAVQQLQLNKDEVVMIGDDIESDVGGAQRAGIRGVLVRTGKYRADAAARSAVKPDAVIDSVADLPHLLAEKS